MNRIRSPIRVAFLATCGAWVLFIAACTSTSTSSTDNNGTDGNNSGAGSDSGNDSASDPSDSVGDVTGGTNGGGPGSGSSATASARIRNESNSRADVTVRFIKDEVVVHLAFVRVMPETVTTVVSPKDVSQVDVSGQDVNGNALTAATLMYGRDFDATRPAEYVITPIIVPDEDDPGEPEPGPIEEPPVDETPVDPVPNIPTITLLEPASDKTLSLGSTVVAQWSDTSDVSGAVVTIGLRAVGTSGFIPMGPAVGAALDGINDQLTMVLQGIPPGVYEIVGRIEDGVNSSVDAAPGKLEIELDPTNVAPTISILSPNSQAVIHDEPLVITWSDEDPDSNATITFELVPSYNNLALGTFPIGPPVAENPDGFNADRLTVMLSGVLAGEYDLVATIDDGELIGTAYLANIVKIEPIDIPANDSPQLVLVRPSVTTSVDPGTSFVVEWTDSDQNDNARISLLLDPDFFMGPLDGDEILLAASISEDEDGPADSIMLGLPSAIPAGTYRVVGVITDGLSELLVQAPGLLLVVQTGAAEDPNDNDPAEIPSIRLVEPSGSMRLRAGDTFQARVRVTDMPYNADMRFYLTNMRPNSIGDLNLNVTPPDFTWVPTTGAADDDDSLEVTLDVIVPADGSLPNLAWPRNFDFKVVAVVGEAEYTDLSAPPVVWVRQEVEILTATTVNYWCTPAGGNVDSTEPFSGIEISWAGGGYGDEDEDVLDLVSFWLTMDGAVPTNDVDDDTHRLINHAYVEGPGPGQQRFTQVSVNDAFGFEFHRYGPYLVMEMALDAGTYSIVPVVVDDSYGRLVSQAAADQVDVCFPLPNAQVSLEP